MAENSYFFNSSYSDKRTYRAEDFARYFESVLSSGIMPNFDGIRGATDGEYGLNVTNYIGSLRVGVKAGHAIIKGHRYELSGEERLTLRPTTGATVNRIDRIVLRLDRRASARHIKLFVVEGQEAYNAESPTLMRNANVHEISLAQVHITGGQSYIDEIVDERLDESVCGIANSLINVPTSAFQQQFNEWFDIYKYENENTAEAWLLEFKEQAEKDADAFAAWLNNKQTATSNAIDAWQAQEKRDFDTWFTDLQERYDGEVAENIELEVIDARGGKVNLGARLAQNEQIIRAQANMSRERLVFPAYDASQQTCHPSTIWDNTKKYGYEWIMAHTPYPNMDDTRENPSIVVSTDGKNFSVPSGLTNPIFRPTDVTKTFFSDVNLCDDGTKLIMIWRETDRTTRLSRLYYSTSTNVTTWTVPQILFDYNENIRGYVAPTLLYIDNKYRLYYKVDASLDSNRYSFIESADFTTWTAPTTVSINFGEWSGHYAWHSEFKRHNGTWYCLANGVKNNKHDDSKLFILTSTDGINFSNCQLVLAPSTSSFGNKHLYKSSFVFWGNQIWLYYSAFNNNNSCHIGLTVSRTGDWTRFAGYNYTDDKLARTNRVQSDDILTVLNAIKILRLGVSGVSLDTDYRDTLKLLADNGTNLAFLNTAGLILDSAANAAIESDGRDNALWVNRTTGQLTMRKDNATASYLRAIKLRITITADGFTTNIFSGGDLVNDVVSTEYGFDVNFKNTRVNYVRPSYILNTFSQTGIVSDGTKNLTSNHMYYATGARLGIALTDAAGGAYMPLATLKSGAFDLTIFI